MEDGLLEKWDTVAGLASKKGQLLAPLAWPL
jgi:hypothetical protein